MSEQATSPIPDGLRDALAELEAYLDGEPVDELSEHVLVLASTWVLGDAGFDLERYYHEAKQFYDVTPEHDRVLSSFPDAMGYYVSLRLMMNERDEIEREAAQAHLDAARAAVGLRVEWLADDYPLIADGMRRLLAETDGDSPPDDRLWRALARRIGDRFLLDWLLRTARAGADCLLPHANGAGATLGEAATEPRAMQSQFVT
jgi:hypothetical protein